jgi:FAD/FMN-containing dehydrogenase
VALPQPRPASPATIDALVAAVGAERVSVAPYRRLEASRDHAWLSPILSAALPDRLADVVVMPRRLDDVARILAIAHDHEAAVTARGKGTGNYGQAVPLAGGIVLDLSDLSGVREVGDGWIDARAGTSFVRLEAAARETGQELAMFPSTVGSALGGFLAGGAGGTGSIENGFLWDGFVHELELLPCWSTPTPISAVGSSARPHLHGYGTTGVIVRARVALRPARPWVALWSDFEHFDEAVAVGRELFALDPPPRNLCIDDAALVDLLPSHRSMRPGRVSLRAIVEASTAPIAAAAAAPATVDPESVALLVSLSYNHVTLRAKRARPDLCHLQVGGPALVERHDEVRAVLPDGMLHLDAHAPGGELGFGGLLLSRFVDAATLYEGVDGLRAMGVHVVDPHTWMLPVDPERQRLASQLDPLGLLNPGKLPLSG